MYLEMLRLDQRQVKKDADGCEGEFVVSGRDMKKCFFCKEWIQDEKSVCPFCGRRQASAPSQSEDSTRVRPKERKGMFCTNCGAELDAKHKFYWNCGHSQTRGTQVEEPVWETCIITYEGVAQSGWFGPGKARWCARATGPEGSYRAGESRPFDAGVWGEEVSVSTHPKDSLSPDPAMVALNELASRLVAEGWEATGLYGASYWTRQYRHLGLDVPRMTLQLCGKFGVKSKPELIQRAKEMGFLSPSAKG